MLDLSLCPLQRVVVAAEAGVQRRRRVLGVPDQHALAALGRVVDARRDQRLGVAALQRGQTETRVAHRGVARRRHDRVGFGEQRVGEREVAGEHMPGRDRVERERKHRERAGITGGLHLPGAELEPGVGVPQLDREPDPRHRQISETLRLGAAELAQRTLQRRRAGAVTVDEARGQPVEHQVVGTRSPGRRRRGAGRHGDLERPARTGEMHGEARRPDRLEIRGTGHSGVERLKTPGRGGEQ